MEYKLAKGTIWLIWRQIVVLVCGYGIHVGIARCLGPEIYGLFGIVLSILVWVETLVCAGIPGAISKFISQNTTLALAIKKEGMKIQIVFSGILFLIFFFTAPLIANLFHDKRLTFYLRVASIDIPLIAAYMIFLNVLNGLRNFIAQSIAGIIYSVSKLIIIYLLIFVGLSLTGAFIGNIAASICGLIAARSLLSFDKDGGEFAKSTIIKFAIPMSLFEVAYNLLMCMDLLFVKAIIKEGVKVGYYVSAVSLAKMPYFFVEALSVSIFPSLSKSIADNNLELSRTYINHAFRFLLIILLPTTLLVITTSESLISLIYSDEYLPAAEVLPILIIGLTFLIFFLLSSVILQSANRPKLTFFIATFLIFVDIIANLILIPLYGLKGAAMATTITGFIGLVITVSFIIIRFHTLIGLKSFFKISTSAISIFLLATTYSTSGILLITNYIILFLIYFGMLYLLKEFTLEDWLRLKTIFSRN